VRPPSAVPAGMPFYNAPSSSIVVRVAGLSEPRGFERNFFSVSPFPRSVFFLFPSMDEHGSSELDVRGSQSDTLREASPSPITSLDRRFSQ